MDKTRLAYLFGRYVHDQCTTDEKAELMVLVELPENEAAVKRLIDETAERSTIEERMNADVANYVLNRILGRDAVPIFQTQNKRKKILYRLRAAAAIIILAVTTYLFIEKTDQEGATTAGKQEAIVPGGDHATLVLGDGTTILLDSMHDGRLQRDGLNISKQNGLLVFEETHSDRALSVSWNTLSTPRGGQYRVMLPDGSEVWLNASSSLRFPGVFSGSRRDVEITGEAYFEVAKDKTKPFIVKTGGLRVEVLGTHFNVYAYPDETEMKTSLLEGSVKISDGTASGLLKPGQQGIVKSRNEPLKIEPADMEEVMAWKNGLFVFNGADIVTIMNQIGRWYDVDISFEGKIPQRSFEGKISREAPLSDVLKILELSGVKFKVSGKTVMIG